MKKSPLFWAVTVCLATLLTGIATAQDMPNEAALIDVLKSDAGWFEKQDACRKLRQIGTAASIPALEPLLTDEKLSHMARYALEPMPFPEVDKALPIAIETLRIASEVPIRPL